MAAVPGITTTPAVDQHIQHNEKEYTTVKEGLAYILIPASAPKSPQTAPKGGNVPQSVFYNPIQQFNRDLSVLAIKAYGEDVMKKKQKSLEKNRQKLQVKKRKRADDSLQDSSRKAGKLDGNRNMKDQTNLKEAAESTANPDLERTAKNQEVQVEHALNSADPGDTKSTEGQEAQPTSAQETKSTEAPPTEPSAASSAFTENLLPSESAVKLPQPQQPKQPTFTILDALSATGLRALRYAHEIPFTSSVTANDLLPDATKSIKLNVQHNKLDDKIEVVTGNALSHMYNVACGELKESGKPKPKYDVIDLDPYGTAAMFLDAAIQSVKDDGGLLCVTCTDAGVWASNGYPEKAYSLYGGTPIKGPQSHEGGLRLILHAIATSAAKYGLAIEPLLSLSIDFYARVFVKIHRSPNEVKFLAGKTMVVYNCDSGCGAWATQMLARNKLAPNKNGKGYFWKHIFALAPSGPENCTHCGMKTHMAGPMYAGPIQSPEFIQKILDGLPTVSRDTYQTYDRIEGMLHTALEEILPPLVEDDRSPTLPSITKRYDPAAIDDYPFFFIPSAVAKVVHCVTPHENALRGALRHLGYRVTRSHTKAGIKTDAPWEVIWEVIREWVKQKAPIKDGAVKEGTAGYNILGLGRKAINSSNGEQPNGSKETPEAKPKIEVVFDEDLGKEKDGKKLVRYQLNPRENWGPMNRATGKDKS